jgi:hypothetical protein
MFNGARPAAAGGTSISGHGTNDAGIDLGEKVCSLLGTTGNTELESAASSLQTGPGAVVWPKARRDAVLNCRGFITFSE